MNWKKTISISVVTAFLTLLMLSSSFVPLTTSTLSNQQPVSVENKGEIAPLSDPMTFTSGNTIDFYSTEEMEIASPNKMVVWSGIAMNFSSTTKMGFVEADGDGLLDVCDWLIILWTNPQGYIPPYCSWWEVIDPATGLGIGEFHVDEAGPTDVHIDMVYPGPIVVVPGREYIAIEKIDIIEPCEYYEVHWPSEWWPQPCTWWEIIDPETGLLTGFEFHVDWTNESCEFHIDEIIPEPYILPFPWYEIQARQKIPSISPCDYFVVEEPPEWWPQPCTWWEILDFHSGEPTGFEFHVDWTNESCEFHIDEIIPQDFLFDFPVPYFIAQQKTTTIDPCDWFVILDPIEYIPAECSWWEILNTTGQPSGLEFHIDISKGDGTFHVDEVIPDPLEIPWLEPTLRVRKKIDPIAPCDWFKVDDPTSFLEPCSWWRIIDPDIGDVEFHIDDVIIDIFHVDQVLGPISGLRPTHKITAERKIDDIQPCDWFIVIDPPGFVPQPCSWWEIVSPPAWAGIVFHVDSNNGIDMFHIDDTDDPPPPPSPPLWNVTARPYEQPPPPWYKKPPYPDYAPSGMPDFDQKQWLDMTYGYTHCGPVAVANSLWWFDSEYEPNTIGPPEIYDNFPMVTAYGAWDDHDPRNVVPLVNNLAFLMDTDGMRTGLVHTGTNYIDMQTGISQYLQQQGINPIGDCDGDGDVDAADIAIINAAFGSTPFAGPWDMRADIVIDNIVDAFDLNAALANVGQVGMFYEHTMDFPDFYYIEEEVERCQDVVLLLSFWQEIEPELWIPVEYPFDLPSGGHYVTVAGVNSTTEELLLSDPWWDAAEFGWPGDVPIAHAGPHGVAVHNDAQFVSHDAYRAFFWPGPPPLSPYPGQPVWELVGYLQQLGYPPTFRTFIRAAVITSPLAGHDVAVTNITTSKTGCLPLETVGKGNNVTIYVTVENQGGFTETFNVTAYANATIIGTLPVTLNPGNIQILTYTWDTTGFAYGNYTISATADTVTGEIDTADNTMVDGTILVTLPGDIDGDRDVDIYDIVRMAGIYGVSKPDPRYDPNCDLDDDGDIDIYDIVAAAGNYGKSW